VEDALIGECNACSVPGRQPVSTDHQQAVEAAKQDPIAETSAWNCFCEITQVTGDNLTACQEKIENPPLNSAGEEVNGWCYVDATTSPPTGNVEIVADCPETERRIIRFVGEGGAKAGATIFITCSGE
jgi:hypothetical protein